MFKEKYLIFRGLDSGHNDGPKVPRKPKSSVESTKPALANQATDMGDILTTETDALIDEVERESELKNEKINKQTEQYLTEQVIPELKKYFPDLSGIYLKNSDLVNKSLLPLIKKGYDSGNPYKFYVTKDRLTLVNANMNIPEESFSFKAYDERLNLPGTRPLEWKFFDSNILPIIKDFKPDFNLNKARIEKNFLISEQIIPVLAEGNKLNDPYKIISTETGFQLVNSKDTQPFNLDPYDEDLEPIVRQKIEHKDTEKKTEEPLKDLSDGLTVGEIIQKEFKPEVDLLSDMQQNVNYIVNEDTSIDLKNIQKPTSEQLSSIYQSMNNLTKKRPAIKKMADNSKTMIDFLQNLKVPKFETEEARDAYLEQINAMPEMKDSIRFMSDEYLSSLANDEDRAAATLYRRYISLLTSSLGID